MIAKEQKTKTKDSLSQTLSHLQIHPFLRLALKEAELSSQESRALSLALQGFSQREIASRLHVSQPRITKIFQKTREKTLSKLPFPPIYI